MEDTPIKVSKSTQRFVKDVSELPSSKYEKVMDMLEALANQQSVEANLERQRGWRYMWQRTPKPYLLMLGYLVFFGAVGSFAYQAFSHVGENDTLLFMTIFLIIMVLPLVVVAYLSYDYIKRHRSTPKSPEFDEASQ